MNLAHLPLTNQRAARQRGLTLIELIVFIVVVGIGVIGILSVLIQATAKSADPIVRKQGIAVAEAMLEEVLLKDFATGGYGGTDRSRFDDVSDYAGFSQIGVTNVLGDAAPGLGAYTVSVAVANTADLTGIGSADAKKITVTVTGSGETFILVGYRTKY